MPLRNARRTSPPRRRSAAPARPRAGASRVAGLAAALLLATGAAPLAQKLEREPFDDREHGYRIRAPRDWTAVPVQPDLSDLGVAALFKGEPIAVTVDNASGSWQPDLHVWVLELPQPAEDESLRRLRELVTGSSATPTIEDRIEAMYFLDFDRHRPEIDETEDLRAHAARHRVWSAGYPSTLGTIPMKLDAWSFELSDREVSLVFTMSEQHWRKWTRTFAAVARSFEEIEREPPPTLAADASYEEVLRFHREDAARVPGWRVLPTTSRRFVVKTSSNNETFLEEAIARLEASRDLFERDFPLPAAFARSPPVSVVRVCGTPEEFRQYGQTEESVVGWFNARTQELVLFDSSEVDRRIAYAVMTHEAFHQYAHLLFGSDPHPWFGEGHGDYYGGFELDGAELEVSARMPGNLDRLGVLRKMIRTERWVPIREHVELDRGAWSAGGVRSYAQSWSIVYMLRQGMLGNVSRKVWRDEYARIVPAYVTTLVEGFRRARATRLAAAQREALVRGDAFDPASLPPGPTRAERNRIWRAAIDASWGRIDLERFERDWLLYAERYLDD